MPAFVEPQLASLVERAPSGDGWVHEVKIDGYRMQLRVEGGRAVLRSRSGLDWTDRYPEVAADAEGLPDCLLDGELTALRKDGTPDFATFQTAMSSGERDAMVFFVFDALFVRGEDLRARPLSERKRRLAELLDEHAADRLRLVDHISGPGPAVHKGACRMGLEGIVSKKLESPYRSGRGPVWVKAKCRPGQEVIVGGWNSHGGMTFRSLIAGVMQDGKLVHVGDIHTGYGQETSRDLMKRLRALETDACPFEAGSPPRKTREIHWAKPELIAEIEFAGWTANGKLRQASFKGLREDKTPEEITTETPEPVEAPAPAPAKRRAKAAPAKGSADKVRDPAPPPSETNHLWSAHGGDPAITNRRLAEYFEAVADQMLPYVKGRPCTAVIAMKGTTKAAETLFWQRHGGQLIGGLGRSPLLSHPAIAERGKSYLQFDTPEALVEAALNNAVELHAWNTLKHHPTTPGRFVFDLDPGPGVPFELVVRAALEVRERLEAIGLAPFLKTTGGKGLHVVTEFTQPDVGRIEWERAKDFARRFCEAMAADSPELYTTKVAPAARVGRIFLDYLRNQPTATAVALLSPRATTTATVSMPLRWKDATPDLDPAAYTVRTAPALLRKRRAWKGYPDARPLAPAMERFCRGG
jgi:bifunctional non-homologous end joining protein LigD